MKHMKRTGHPVDVQVGLNIIRLRRVYGVTQEKLASGLGITFQQVQKYEKGTNRVSCSKLVRMAALLQVPLLEFFKGIDLKSGSVTAKGAGHE